MKSTRKTEDIHGKHFSSIGEDLLRTQFMEKKRETVLFITTCGKTV